MHTEHQPSARRTRNMNFTVGLGRALHRYGAPVDRIEATMAEVAARLGLRGQFFVEPTSIQVAFGRPGHQHAYLVRATPSGDVDLGRLDELDNLASKICRGDTTADDGAQRLAAILDAPPRYGRATLTAAFGLVSGAAARVLGGGQHEILIAGAVGLLLGAAAIRLGSRPRIAPVLPAMLAAVAALAATAAAAAGLTAAPWLVTLASLIVFIPGLMLTLAMREVATGHLSSGTARMTGAAATFLALGCGIAFADHVARASLGVGAVGSSGLASAPLEAWTEPAAYAACAVGFVVLFGARRRDLPWLMLGCFAAFAGSAIGSLGLGARLVPFAGALAVGLAGNAFARLADRPAVIPMLPGLLLLVPGSLGLRSLSALLADDVVGGMGMAFSMAFAAAALVSGLLFANVLVSPRPAAPTAPRGRTTAQRRAPRSAPAHPSEA